MQKAADHTSTPWRPTLIRLPAELMTAVDLARFQQAAQEGRAVTPRSHIIIGALRAWLEGRV